jgi:pimeloyl-ACP methyl ester carboxylesterase
LHDSRGFFNIEGIQLEYQLLSPSKRSDLTLVLLHEGLGCLAMWKDFPRQLAKLTGCQTLTYSRAGYGASSPCSRPWPLTFMHNEGLNVLPKIIEAAKINKAVLVGHSDGASIALINAGGIADERIRGLVLMAPHVFVEELTLASIRESRSAYENSDLRARLARYHGDKVDSTFLGWANAWLDKGFLTWNLEAFLPAIEIPTLLIQGSLDNYGTRKQLDTINELLPGGAEMNILHDCGHSPFRECPGETLQAIAGFLDKYHMV